MTQADLYVYEGVEVKMTGRVGKRTIQKTHSNPEYVEYLYEISPIDPTGPQWTKWVKKDQLFEITTVEGS